MAIASHRPGAILSGGKTNAQCNSQRMQDTGPLQFSAHASHRPGRPTEPLPGSLGPGLRWQSNKRPNGPTQVRVSKKRPGRPTEPLPGSLGPGLRWQSNKRPNGPTQGRVTIKNKYKNFIGPPSLLTCTTAILATSPSDQPPKPRDSPFQSTKKQKTPTFVQGGVSRGGSFGRSSCINSCIA